MRSKKMSNNRLIHVAKIHGDNRRKKHLFLREVTPSNHVWFDDEIRTDVNGETAEEAIKLAGKHWQDQGFETLKCGFRYTLPERDEHGMNAFFHEMIASFSSLQGAYFDPDLGHMCEVKNPSLEAIKLWKELKLKNRL